MYSSTCFFFFFGSKTLDISFFLIAFSIQTREIHFKRGQSEVDMATSDMYFLRKTWRLKVVKRLCMIAH